MQKNEKPDEICLHSVPGKGLIHTTYSFRFLGKIADHVLQRNTINYRRPTMILTRHSIRFTLMSMLLFTGGFAQEAAPREPSTFITVRSVRFDAISTPDFQYNVRGVSTRRDGRRDWLQLTTEYDQDLPWLDELTVTFYVVLTADERNFPQGAPLTNMFTGSVTYQNIKRGRHRSTMFLDPNTFERFGRPSAVAVVYNVQGRAAGGEVQPQNTAASRWWTTQTPHSIPLLNRAESPWALVEIEQFQTIKP